MIFSDKYKKILSQFTDFELIDKLKSIWPEYEFFLRKNSLITKDMLSHQRKILKSLKKKPKISLIIPLFNPEKKEFEKLIRSIIIQPYWNFEVCFYDDASNDKTFLNILNKYKKYLKFKIQSGEKNLGISLATYEAFKLADGDFIGLIDQDDELMPYALFDFIKAYNEVEFDIFYSDYDKINKEGYKYWHFFKPGWSPNYLLSLNYFSHFDVYRKSLIYAEEIYLNRFDGAQDYLLALDTTLKTDKIFHFAKICYSWRESSNSIATMSDNKTYAFDNAKKAIKHYLYKSGKLSDVEDVVDISPNIKGCYKILFKKSTFQNMKHILLTNSKEISYYEYLKTTFKDFSLKIVHINNFSRELLSEYDNLIFSLDKIKFPVNFSLENLLGFARFDRNGFVSPKFLTVNHKIHNVGVYMNNAYEVFYSLNGIDDYNEKNDPGYGFIKIAVKDVLSVFPIFSLIESKKFFENFNQDKIDFFSLIKLNIKLFFKGYKNVVVASEKVFLDFDIEKYDISDSFQRNFGKLKKDPFYNINLTDKFSDFGIKI